MSSNNDNEPIDPTLDKGVVSCWVVLLNWTTGCESDAESTEVKAVFFTKEEADNYCKVLKNKINWNNYYQGCLDVDLVPFQPCS